MITDKPAIVIDNGSYIIKAGFACDNHPVSMFQNVVGRPGYLKRNYGQGHYDVLIGDEAVEKIDDLEPSYPVMNGKIVHWDNMERIWHHIFYRELKAAPDDRDIMLALSSTSPLEEKIKCCEIFFETFNAPTICIQSQSVLALYGSGITTGICVDLGHDTTKIDPVFEGGQIKYGHMETGYAGRQIHGFIKHSIENCRTGNASLNSKDIEQIIRQHLYITKNCAVSKKQYVKKHSLANGEDIDVSDEAFYSAAAIFQPHLIVSDKTNFQPIHEVVVTSASKCDSELRNELYDAVVLCGGLAMVPGISDRLAVDIENLINRPVTILSSTEAYALAWLGGATFAGLSDAQKMWLHKKQYEDYGVKALKSKFL